MRLALLLAWLVAFPLAALPPEAAAQAEAPPEWWGSTDPKAGYHLRIPVTVTNPTSTTSPNPLTLQDPVVRLDLDLARHLKAAGWPTSATGSPKGFSLDMESIRVVAMTNLKSPGSGNDGKPLIYDPTAAGDNRYVAPSTAFEGLLADGSAAPFNAESNPAVTVFFRIQGTLEPTRQGTSQGQRWFYVYFDSIRNPGHDTPPPVGPEAGAIRSLHWGGPGTLTYGYIPPVGEDELGKVSVVGLHAGTTYTIEVDNGGFAAYPGLSNLAIGANQVQLRTLPSLEGGTPFRIRSNFPLLAFAESKGFVPSLEGGFAGRQFLFQAGDLSAYFADAGTKAGSTIRVEPLAGGTTQVMHVADASNPQPYTLGAWASERADGNCGPAGMPANALKLEPGKLYKATVTGGPVLLQQGTPAALMQAPALDGGPVGQDFASVLHETTFKGGAGCAADPRNRDWAMAGTALGSAKLLVSGSDVQRALPQAPQALGPFSDGRNAKNRPAQWTSSPDAWLFTGEAGPGSIPTVAGALGGEDGRRFMGFGEAVVFGLYPETKVQVQVIRTNSGTTARSEALGEGDVLRISNEGTDRVVSYVVSADRPLAVYAARERPGFLASRPMDLAGLTGRLEFRGFALGLQVTPPERSALPGKPVQYTLTISNLARSATGAGQEDVVDLTVAGPGEGWQATLNKEFVGIAANGVQTAILTVTPPTAAQARDQAVFMVTATSRGNPTTQVSEKATAYLKSSYGVGLWFDVAGGGKAQTQVIQPKENVSNMAHFTLVVRNEGTVDDRILLSTGAPLPGWSFLLLDDEEDVAVEAFDLPPDQSATFRLRVTAPNISDGALTTAVTAQSVSENASFDRATATTKVTAPSDIEARVWPMSALVAPGQEGVFTLTLTNVGKGSAQLVFENATSAPEGWPVPHTFFIDPSGQRLPLTTLSLTAGESGLVNVALGVPKATPAGETAQLRLAARSNETTLAFEVFPVVVAMAVHDIRLEGPTGFDMPAGASLLNATLQLANHGNVNETLRLVAGSMPAGWTIEAPDNVSVLPGETVSVSVRLEAGRATAAGRYNLTLVAIAADGTFHDLNLTASVQRAGAASAALKGDSEAQPGRAVAVPIPVENTANTQLVVRIQAAEGEPWQVADSTPVTLEPGEKRMLDVVLLVPLSAPDGESTHKVRLSFSPTTPGLAGFERTVDLAIAVDRPVLRILSHQAAFTPGGRLVTLVVANEGSRTAHEVVLELASAGELRDRQRLDSLPANATAVISLLDSEGRGRLEVTLDPDGVVASPPLAPLVVATDDKDAPAPAFTIATTALLALAALLRRRINRCG